MLTITKDFSFDASHRLNREDWSEEKNKEVYGKCNNIPNHGHTYKLSVTLEGTIDETGMIINFSDLKKIVNETIIETMDHKNLDSTGLPQPSTCENMIIVIFQTLKTLLNGPNYRLKRLDLYEQIYPTNSYASYEE